MTFSGTWNPLFLGFLPSRLTAPSSGLPGVTFPISTSPQIFVSYNWKVTRDETQLSSLAFDMLHLLKYHGASVDQQQDGESRSRPARTTP